MSASRAADAHDLSSPVPTLRSQVVPRDEGVRFAPLRTVLVPADLTDASRSVVLRAAEIARKNGGRLVVCHAAPDALRVNPLFPHRLGESIAKTAENEYRIVETLTEKVAEWTGLSHFDVVVDFGEPARVLCTQATRHSADLIVAPADQGDESIARGLAASPCSVLLLGPSAGRTAALVTLESEMEWVPALARAANEVSGSPFDKFLVVLWADSEDRKAPLLAALETMRDACGAPIEPWFADLDDPSTLARVAADPAIGLVALTAPRPDNVVARQATPIDDAIEGATASFLLLRR